MRITINQKHCIRCGKVLPGGTPENVCLIHLEIDKHNATKKYLKHQWMFFGLYNNSITNQIGALGIHYTKDSKIYLDLKRIFEQYPSNYLEIIVYCMSHEYLHKVITKDVGHDASHMMDCKYIRNLIDAYLGCVPVGI